MRPWGWVERVGVRVGWIRRLGLLTAVVPLYFASGYLRENFRETVWDPSIRVLGEDAVFRLATHPSLVAFALTVAGFLLLLELVYVQPKNPVFIPSVGLWGVYSLLSVRDTWLSYALTGESVAPQPFLGLRASFAVLVVPVLLAFLVGRFYDGPLARGGPSEPYFVSRASGIRWNAWKLLGGLVVANIVLAAFHRLHPFMRDLWAVETAAGVLFLLFLFWEYFQSQGETLGTIAGRSE